MAEQDFDINIRTKADLEGLNTVEEQLKAAGIRFDQARQEFVLIEKEASEATKDTAEATKDSATALEQAADASQVFSTGLSLTNRQMAILGNLAASGQLNMRGLLGLLRGFGTGAAAAAIGGFVLYETIKKAREEAEKLATGSASFAEALQRNAMAAQVAITGARTGTDIKGVAAATLSDIQTLQAEANKLAQKEIEPWQKAIEDLREGIIQMSPTVTEAMRQWAHPYTIELREAQERMQQLAITAQNLAASRIEKAQDFKRQFGEFSKLPLEEALKRINGIIEQQTQLLEVHKKSGDIKSFIGAQEIIDQRKKDMVDLIKFHKERESTAKSFEQKAARSDSRVAQMFALEASAKRAMERGQPEYAEQFREYAAALRKSGYINPKAEKLLGQAGEIRDARTHELLQKMIQLWE